MELNILGKTGDDKGTQLEKLTAFLLQEHGYTSIYTNVVNAGASEVDIKATFIQPFMAGAVSRDVIGECKAYSRPVTLPDWLKFLGKIFSEEINGRNVQGCFIALSGVNGNVVGHYDTIKNKRPDIQLLSGEDLSILLHQHFSVLNITEIQAIVQSLTTRQPVNYSLCYYDNKFYWRIAFAENGYALLNGDGKAVGQNNADVLHEMIVKDSDLTTYIDLQQEKTASERTEMINRYIISTLLIENQNFLPKEILAKVKAHFSESLQSLKLAEVKAAISNLEQFRLVLKTEGKYNLMLFSDSANLEDILSFYGYFTFQNVVVKGLISENYGLKIDEHVLDHIIMKQGNVKLSSEKYNECLQLIRWSPSALAWGLAPDPHIVNHRFNGAPLDPKFEKHDANYFVRKMYELFKMEFNNQYLSSYFFALGLRDVETKSTTKVTGENGIAITNESHVRMGLGRLTEEYNNQIISMLFIDPDSTTNDVDHSKTKPMDQT
jgi:hypothetical protein